MQKRLHPYSAAVLDTLRRRRLVEPGDRVLVALSSGPDSTALLAALAEIRDSGRLGSLELAALHVDHGLRAGAEQDAACAAGSCERLGVPFESVSVSVSDGNVQAAARRARYAALRSAAARLAATRIATGHTRTDQAETVLLRLLRGAGARGLAGIPPRRGAIVRPLIDRSREEGIAFLAERGLAWRADPTNATPSYTRNRLRLEVWPPLLALAPAAERAIARAADLARDDERALVRAARTIAGAGASVAVASLRDMPAAVRTRVVRHLWRSAGGKRDALDVEHVAAVLALTRGGRPRRVALPGGFEARSRYGTLEVVRAQPRVAPVASLEIRGPGRYPVPRRGVVVAVSCHRAEAVPWPIVLRSRLPGDRFEPDGGAGTKKLKSWLIDRKVPREARDALLVLASGDRVVALPQLGVVARGLGAGGAGLDVRIEPPG